MLLMTLKKHIKHGFGLNNLGHAYSDMLIFIIPLLIPLLKEEFSLNYIQSGLILTVHIGIRSLFSYISGHLGDLYDKRIIISVGFLVSSLMLAAFILVDTIPGVIIILFIMAVG